MIKMLKRLLGRGSGRTAPPAAGAAPRPGYQPAGKASKGTTEPDPVEVMPMVSGRLSSNGPGKNVLIRKPGEANVAGADNPSIDDELKAGSNDGAGIDPYNTGKFDRSKNWDKRFRK